MKAKCQLLAYPYILQENRANIRNFFAFIAKIILIY